MVQWQAQEEGHVHKEISAHMKITRRDARVSKSARAWKPQEDVKIIGIYYIDSYVEK